MDHQQAQLLVKLASRSKASIDMGGDGFVSLSLLRFDVGLSTQAIRRYLDAAVSEGKVEHLQRNSHQPHTYRALQLLGPRSQSCRLK